MNNNPPPFVPPSAQLKISSPCELRALLCYVLIRLHDGTIETDRANAISGLAAQVNASLSAEAKGREA